MAGSIEELAVRGSEQLVDVLRAARELGTIATTLERQVGATLAAIDKMLPIGVIEAEEGWQFWLSAPEIDAFTCEAHLLEDDQMVWLPSTYGKMSYASNISDKLFVGKSISRDPDDPRNLWVNNSTNDFRVLYTEGLRLDYLETSGPDGDQ